jgi:hypothetical protein
MPLAAIENATKPVQTESLQGADEAAFQRVKEFLAQHQKTSGGLYAAARNEKYRLPRGFQNESRGETEFGARFSLPGETFALSLGVNSIDKLTAADPDQEVTMDGSAASLRVLGQIVSVSQIDRWWGPSQQGGAILGSAARPFPALSIQRGTHARPETDWLQWLGPWNYQILLGQLEDYDAVPHAKLFGMRVSFKPFDVVDVGLSRTMQWGGKGRPQDFDSFVDGFLGDSNAGSGKEDPANQLAGGDLRIQPLGRSFPLVVFGEVIGEDEAGGLPSRIFGTMGFEARVALGNTPVTFRGEATETTTDNYFGKNDKIPQYTYRNGAYPDGYYQQGLPLGYPIGGDGELYMSSLSAIDRRGIRYEVRFVRAFVNETAQTVNLAYPDTDKITAGIIKLSAPLPFGAIHAVAAYQDSEQFGSDAVGNLMLTLDWGRVTSLAD